jgi:hypothetical protein
VDPEAGVTNWIPVIRTEHVMDNLNPVFKAFDISVEELCYCNPEWPLRLVLYDWQKKGKHREMGMYDTSLADLQENISQGGNADRDSAVPVDKKGVTNALIVILKAGTTEG